jgi:hypothetical protein
MMESMARLHEEAIKKIIGFTAARVRSEQLLSMHMASARCKMSISNTAMSNPREATRSRCTIWPQKRSRKHAAGPAILTIIARCNDARQYTETKIWDNFTKEYAVLHGF